MVLRCVTCLRLLREILDELGTDRTVFCSDCHVYICPRCINALKIAGRVDCPLAEHLGVDVHPFPNMWVYITDEMLVGQGEFGNTRVIPHTVMGSGMADEDGVERERGGDTEQGDVAPGGGVDDPEEATGEDTRQETQEDLPSRVQVLDVEERPSRVSIIDSRERRTSDTDDPDDEGETEVIGEGENTGERSEREEGNGGDQTPVEDREEGNGGDQTPEEDREEGNGGDQTPVEGGGTR